MRNVDVEFKCRGSKTYLKTTRVLPQMDVRLSVSFPWGDLLLLPLSTWPPPLSGVTHEAVDEGSFFLYHPLLLDHGFLDSALFLLVPDFFKFLASFSSGYLAYKLVAYLNVSCFFFIGFRAKSKGKCFSFPSKSHLNFPRTNKNASINSIKKGTS